MRRPNSCCRSLFPAFTLIELLVAAAIFGVLALLAASVVGSVNSLSNQATEKLAAARLAREVFDLIERDLARVVVAHPSRGLESPVFFGINPPEIPAVYNHACSVVWQMTAARNPEDGNISIVGYFVQRAASNRSQLRRLFVEPTDAEYSLYEGPGWFRTEMLERFLAADSPGEAVASGDPGWVADGVIALWVRVLDADGNVISRDGAGAPAGYRFDSRQGYQTGDDTSGRRHSGFNALPAYVEIAMVCVSPRDAERIESFPDLEASNPENFTQEVASFLDAFQAANPRIKTATALTRRCRLPHGN